MVELMVDADDEKKAGRLTFMVSSTTSAAGKSGPAYELILASQIEVQSMGLPDREKYLKPTEATLLTNILSGGQAALDDSGGQDDFKRLPLALLFAIDLNSKRLLTLSKYNTYSSS
jgi:hypothetical protein